MQKPTEQIEDNSREINLTPADEARFWAKVDKRGPDECWLWTAGKFNTGYGAFRAGGKHRGAHCVAWMITRGPIPHDGSSHGLCVCHNCPGGDRPDCVNPAHLWLGTNEDNVRDREAKGRGNPARGDKNGARTHPERLRRGEAHRNAKLTAEKVIEIRALYAAGGVSQDKLGAQFGVDRTLISYIINRKKWAHI